MDTVRHQTPEKTGRRSDTKDTMEWRMRNVECRIKADEEMLNDKGLPALDKVKSILFAPEMQAYYGIGNFLGKAFSIGKEI